VTDKVTDTAAWLDRVRRALGEHTDRERGCDTSSLDAAALDAIQARADAATDGPWQTDGMSVVHGPEFHELDQVVEYVREDADREFVAAARSDVPALVVEVRRLAADLAVEQSGAAIGARNRADLHAEIDKLRAERTAVRELHAPQLAGRVKSGNAEIGVYECHACSPPVGDGSADWPCATAEVVYTAEEIEAVLSPIDRRA
jgi:hypothetical protein